MSDGFVGLFLVPDEGASVPILSANGTMVVEEELIMSGSKVSSQAKITLSGVQLSSGVINYVSLERIRDGVNAINYVTFVSNPTDTQTITVNGVAYTFRNPLPGTGTNLIAIGTNVNETFTNFIRAINDSGADGTEYRGVTENSHFTAFSKSGRVAQLVAKSAGLGGNAYTLSTSSSGIIVNSATAFGGVDSSTYSYEVLGNFPVYQTDGTPGFRGTANNTTVIRIENMPYSPSGINWKFRAKYFNGDGQQATNSGGTAQVVESSSVVFDGKDILVDYAEVFNLRVTNAQNPEGALPLEPPANLPPGGLARLEWADMSTLSTKLQTHPCADGIERTISEAMLSTVKEYAVYMFISSDTAGPTNQYPSPATDGNGSWYLVTKTKDTWAEVQCPKNKRIAFWVGFGTEDTSEKSNTSKLPSIAYADYSS